MNNRIIDDHGTGLSAEDFAALRENLHEQRLFRREQLHQLSAASSRADALPSRRSAAQLEVRVKLAASARLVLADVEAALTRMDLGRYGICRDCAKPIPVERLEILPYTPFCVPCQRKAV